MSRISAKIKKWKLHKIAFKFGIINFLKWLSRIKAKIKKFISLKYFCLYSFLFSIFFPFLFLVNLMFVFFFFWPQCLCFSKTKKMEKGNTHRKENNLLHFRSKSVKCTRIQVTYLLQLLIYLSKRNELYMN